MVTLTANEASANLPKVLARVLEGEQIGIECEGRIVELRPALEDAAAEYELSPGELASVHQRISRDIQQEKRSGALKKL